MLKSSKLYIFYVAMSCIFELVCNSGFACAGNMEFRDITFEEAKKEAAEKGKNIMVVVSSKSCPGTKMLRDFLNRPLASKIAKNYFVPVEFIIGEKRGADIASKLGGNGFPRNFILDQNGDVLYSFNAIHKNRDFYYLFLLKGARGDKKEMKKLAKMVDKEFKSKMNELAPFLVMVTAKYISGSKSSAKKLSRKYLAKHTDADTYAEFAWAWVYNMECDGKTALQYAKEYKKRKDNGYSAVILAWAHYLNGDAEKAVSCMQDAIKILGNKAKVHHTHDLERFKREHAKKAEAKKNENDKK